MINEGVWRRRRRGKVEQYEYAQGDECERNAEWKKWQKKCSSSSPTRRLARKTRKILLITFGSSSSDFIVFRTGDIWLGDNTNPWQSTAMTKRNSARGNKLCILALEKIQPRRGWTAGNTRLTNWEPKEIFKKAKRSGLGVRIHISRCTTGEIERVGFWQDLLVPIMDYIICKVLGKVTLPKLIIFNKLYSFAIISIQPLVV